MYLILQTWPEFIYSVFKLTQFMSNPHKKYWIALKKVLKYLESTQKLGIYYSKLEKKLTLSAWINASWEKDSDNNKSTYSYMIFMQRRPSTWKSQKQQFVTFLSTKAKYVG